MIKYIILILMLSVYNCFAADIYVDNTLPANCTAGNYSIANRDCNGSDGNAYTSVQAALNAMNGGDVVILRGGTYQEGHIRIDHTKDGTAEHWSTIKSFPGEWAILDGQNGGGDGGLNGLVVGGDKNSRCVLGLAVSDGAGNYQMAYWKFERLEIKNGASADFAYAAGFDGNMGPFWFKYCYIHDNQAVNGSNNPGGIKGQQWQDSIVEYCYFNSNGAGTEVTNHNCADINIYSDYKPDEIAENGYPVITHSNMRNIYRYNLFESSPTGIKYKQDQLFSGRNAAGGHPLSDTYKTYGDKIHNNIFRKVHGMAIDGRQDFIQIYNNIFDSCDKSVSIGEGDTRSIYKATVYNNTIFNNRGVWSVHSWRFSFQPAQYYGYAYNNILDNVTDGWNWSDLSIDTLSTFGGHTPDYSNYIADKNYSYRPDTTYFKDTSGEKIAWIGDTRYTVSEYEALYPGKTFYRNDYNANNLLYKGTSGADKYKTRGNHVVEGSTTIANGGIGGAHPYLSGVTIPSYIGAVNPNGVDSGRGWDPDNPDPDDAGWVDYVLCLKWLLHGAPVVEPDGTKQVTTTGTPTKQIVFH